MQLPVMDWIRLTDLLNEQLTQQFLRAWDEKPHVTGFHVLDVLHRHGPMKASDIALYYNYSKATLSNVTTQLVEEGWVQRLESPSDGRVFLLMITPDGLKAWHRGKDAERQVQKEIEKMLTPREWLRFQELQIKLLAQDK